MNLLFSFKKIFFLHLFHYILFLNSFFFRIFKIYNWQDDSKGIMVKLQRVISVYLLDTLQQSSLKYNERIFDGFLLMEFFIYSFFYFSSITVREQYTLLSSSIFPIVKIFFFSFFKLYFFLLLFFQTWCILCLHFFFSRIRVTPCFFIVFWSTFIKFHWQVSCWIRRKMKKKRVSNFIVCMTKKN